MTSGPASDQICGRCGYPRAGLPAGPCPECGSEVVAQAQGVRSALPLWAFGLVLLPLLPMLAGIIEDHSDYGFPGSRLAKSLQILSLALWMPCITIGLGRLLRGRNFEPYWTAGGIAFISMVLAWPCIYILGTLIVARLQQP